MRKHCLIAISILIASSSVARAQGPALTPERIEAALYRYRGEPSVERVVRAAIDVRTADPARARDAIDRARLSGLLPTLRAALRRGQAVDLRGLTNTGDIGSNFSTGDDLTLEGRLIFNLDRLVYAAPEARLLRELRELEEARAELVRSVIALYFERRRLQLERDLLGQNDLPHALRILETEALLDSFTGGEFTRMMGARQTEPQRP